MIRWDDNGTITRDNFLSGGLATLLLGGLTLIGACATQAPPFYEQSILQGSIRLLCWTQCQHLRFTVYMRYFARNDKSSVLLSRNCSVFWTRRNSKKLNRSIKTVVWNVWWMAIRSNSTSVKSSNCFRNVRSRWKRAGKYEFWVQAITSHCNKPLYGLE